MDIGKFSMVNSQMKTNTSVNIALMCKAKDQAESNAAELMKVLETVAVDTGSKLDVKV